VVLFWRARSSVPLPNVISISEGTALQKRAKPSRDSFLHNHLLADIGPAAYTEIAAAIEPIRYAPNEIIFEENDPGDCLYLIAEGAIRISKKGRAGQQETLAYLMANDFLGEMALIDTGKRSAQAAAVDDVLVGRLDRKGWNLLLRLAPSEVMSNFTKTVTARLRQNNQNFINEMMRNERLSLIGTTISSIVHDMNNPISCILGACHVIKGTNHDETTTKMASLIKDAVDSMWAMTNELIDFSRGSTQLKLESIKVGELIHKLNQDFAKCRPIVDVRIEVLYDGRINVDRHRIIRVFANLIKNAREAMAKTDEKILRFIVKRVDSRLHFEVADTGCGIPPELLPRMFEPFVTHGKANGTGLGLAISKSVVEAHHGLIWVKSSERGTSFTIDLPLDPH
jgi:signal transduction histidine kinase